MYMMRFCRRFAPLRHTGKDEERPIAVRHNRREHMGSRARSPVAFGSTSDHRLLGSLNHPQAHAVGGDSRIIASEKSSPEIHMNNINNPAILPTQMLESPIAIRILLLSCMIPNC